MTQTPTSSGILPTSKSFLILMLTNYSLLHKQQAVSNKSLAAKGPLVGHETRRWYRWSFACRKLSLATLYSNYDTEKWRQNCRLEVLLLSSMACKGVDTATLLASLTDLPRPLTLMRCYYWLSFPTV